MSLSHFDERSGIIAAETSWGRWWQTCTEVFIEIDIPPGTRSKNCRIVIKPNFIECHVKDEEIFKGSLYKTIKPDGSTWTVEGRNKIMILLEKAERFDADNIWVSLLEGQFVANPYILNEMRKKLDLEIYQIQNPGFNFSGAELFKNYETAPHIPTDSSK